MAAAQTRKGTRPAATDYEIAEEEEYYVTRPHTSVRRYRQPVQRDTLDDYAPEQAAFIQHRRASKQKPAGGSITSQAINPSPSLRARVRRTPWLGLGLGVLLALVLVIGFNTFASWWQVHQEDATYGVPRTYQTDAVVGHQDSASKPSHFLFLNLQCHVTVIELPGGDAAHVITYTGPTLFGGSCNLVPVTGEFRDVNRDGRPDMLVHVQDQTFVFINDGSKFRSLQPGEHVTT